MKVHRLEREQWLAAPGERVFGFFADAANPETLAFPRSQALEAERSR